MLGVARLVRAELAIDFATVELENFGLEAANAVVRIYGKIQRSRKANSDLDLDMEYV